MRFYIYNIMQLRAMFTSQLSCARSRRLQGASTGVAAVQLSHAASGSFGQRGEAAALSWMALAHSPQIREQPAQAAEGRAPQLAAAPDTRAAPFAAAVAAPASAGAGGGNATRVPDFRAAWERKLGPGGASILAAGGGARACRCATAWVRR